MPLRVTFELSDKDLRHFRSIMRHARHAARKTPEKKIVASARKLAAAVEAAEVPDFVRERLAHLPKLVAMLEDREWSLSGDNRDRIVSALAYFNEPVDLIPDSVPGLGFIDDAIMVELVVTELRPDIEAYDDFCAFRRKLDGRRKSAAARPAEAQASLEARRRDLHARMRRRRMRRRSARQRTPSSTRPFSLF
ncbi:MAG: DUF1232 domain-containing protein [Myxococcales bacterium]|nr:DUF1232 domain-containing protein [Myxococcales bacterium]